MRVLVLSPHTDDAELGCGATIAKHIQDGDKVKMITFSSCGHSLPAKWKEPQYEGYVNILRKEHEMAMISLDVDDWQIIEFPVRRFRRHEDRLRDIIYLLVNKSFRPNIVYTIWSGAEHQDHQAIYELTHQVIRKKSIKVYGYFVPDDGVGFAPKKFVEFYGTTKWYPYPIERKFAALNHYQSQRELRHWWNMGTFLAGVNYWAACTSAHYAEAFEVIREVSK